ncbi:hypothetical protein MNBD_ACTINO01-2360 [hydrothermal vent metagenome]|uniref:META domain-containing protein n=1 Tax=hydrothermal vent metagenome TaxID=652676 RepID=A0A3B0TKZ6_9ZZZZ
MHERDLIREARAALDDLVDLAPKAPKLQSITAGYATLRRAEPPLTRWRPVTIFAVAAVVTLLVVGIASLIGSNVGDSDGVAGPGTSTTTSEESLQGIWVLSTYTFEGATQLIDEATLAVQGQIPAWIEFTGDGVLGYTGCNRIERTSRPVFEGDRLVFGEIIVQAGGCMGETSEPALLDALWSGSDGVELTLTGTTMTWSTDTVVLTFTRREQRPTAVPGTWDSSIGRLDCSPGVYLTRMIPVTGQPPDDLLNALMAVPGVTTVWEGDLFWWGLDGGIIAGGTYVDTDPRVIQLVVCAESFDVLPDADLTGQTLTWVNQLGLVQTSTLVWSERFIELCSVDDADLATLAKRYIAEDAATSVRDDGSLPTVGQTAQTLEMIQRGTCATDRSPTTTTTVITSTDSSGIGDQPEITDDMVSPSWVTVDDEDSGAIIQSVLDGEERPTLSDTIVQTVIENLPSNGWVPYLYRASIAGDTPISETVEVYLGNTDALSVTWYYRWDDTPGCDICEANSVPWDNGWMVWTDADPARGIIQYHAFHPDFPMNATIVFFPDPIEWPEATAEDKPVLRTQPGEAAAVATSILDSLANTIPMPDRAAP